MNKPLILIKTVAFLALGGGIINLLSVMTPILTERRLILREIFPLEFLHLSRFLTLLIGFALIVSSINIYKRKKRAFKLVFLMSISSIIFNLTKGLDYEQALFSFVLLLVLFKARKIFTVMSSTPDLQLQLFRFGIAIIIAFFYSIIGFWLLDPRHFDANFNLLDSFKKTFLIFSLIGDPDIVPRTRYAHWFLNSLYLMTTTAIGYSMFVLFRPVIYIYKTLPHERAQATAIVNQYGRCSIDYFKYWHDKSYFFSPSQKSFVAYRVGGNYALALGDPVGPEEELEDIIRRFMKFCSDNDWGIGFHQTLPDFLPLYQKFGFKKLKIGDEAVVDLTQFSLEGKPMKRLRNYFNKFDTAGFHVDYYDSPISDDIIMKIKEVSDEWFQIPGRRERGFTLGMFEPNYIRSTPVICAMDKNGVVQAFVNVIPSFQKGESTLDLMRRRIKSPDGIMDYLFGKIFLYFKEKGYARFSLGMAPMSGFQEKEEASIEERAVYFFFTRLNFLFSYTGLQHFKAKYASFWEPRYLIYQNAIDLPRLAVALSLVSEIRGGVAA